LPVRFDEKNETVLINELEIHNRDIYDHLSKSSEPAEETIHALQVGCISLSRVQTSNQVDFVAARTRQLLNDVSASLTTTENKFQEILNHTKEELCKGQMQLLAELDPQKKTSLATRLEEQFLSKVEKLQNLINETFSQDGTAAKTLKNVQKDESEGLRKEIQILRDYLTEQFVSLKEPPKASYDIGLEFEELCKTKLSEFCENSGFGLILEDVRNTPGVGDSKKGDYVISHENIEPICLEMKNKSMTLPACISEMEEAKSNRNAGLVILVGAEETLPSGVGVYNEFGQDKIMCTLEVLPIALKLAYLRAKNLKNGVNALSDGVDIKAAMVQAEDIVTSLGKLNKLSANCGKIKKIANVIDETASDIKNVLEEKSQNLIAILSGKKEENDHE
jgi:hypothetical protein